ncbi:MAG: TIGR04282 family arsenosugar biosynthesis glycosyltransferase [Pseudomonadota bacterium]
MSLPVAVAIMAKAPVAGLAKTRLAPALGAAGAARLQRRLTLQALHTAQQANVGPVTLFCAPDPHHRFFRALSIHIGVRCVAQHPGDLGQRMHAAVQAAAGPVLVVGTDCPALTPADLQAAAQHLRDGHDAVVQPAEDGGYVLIGLRAPCWPVFNGVAWSTDQVMPHTRARLAAQGLRWLEAPTLWDVDVPADLPRLRTLPGW